VAKLEDLREWLTDRIDGSEETRGEDSLISHFINQIDALPSEITEPRGCPTPGSCSAVEELADLKQRLLPQANGRAERAEKARQMAVVERDEMLEKLRDSLMPSAFFATPDRPDWAQQLPGAELYDRAARYEYIRTLNPRKFSALYNEALMGVHQFDDLVDRYRAKGKTVECGYDRSASLNAGKYVCTCGGACSHYDAGGR